MREHMGLYRGKRVDNGEWVEGFLCKKYFHEAPHDRYVIQYKTVQDGKMWRPDYMVAEVGPETVGECTGLPDKYGKLIFEGDVFDWGYAGVHDKRYVVAYDAELAYFVGLRGAGFVSLNGIDVEIIGNIHDNPELLKGGDGE